MMIQYKQRFQSQKVSITKLYDSARFSAGAVLHFLRRAKRQTKSQIQVGSPQRMIAAAIAVLVIRRSVVPDVPEVCGRTSRAVTDHVFPKRTCPCD
jgi:hypothetical protein